MFTLLFLIFEDISDYIFCVIVKQRYWVDYHLDDNQRQ